MKLYPYLLLIFLCWTQLALAEADNSSIYQLTSAYNDYNFNFPFERLAGYNFYFDRLNSIEDRKLGTIACESENYSQGFFWKITLYPNYPDFINSDRQTISNTPLLKIYNSRDYYKTKVECVYHLKTLYKDLLSKSAILNLHNETGFQVLKTENALVKTQLDLNRKMQSAYLADSGGSLAFYHGRKTEFVFVFIHGLYMSSSYFINETQQVFRLGHNSFALSFNCQGENICISDPQSWKSYATSFIKEIASKYGEKVILVGHSLGAHIALQLSKESLADGLILLEPAFKTAWPVRLALKSQKLFENSDFYKKDALGIYLGGLVQNYINKEQNLSEIKIQVPTLIYADQLDPIVSYSTIKKFAEITRAWSNSNRE